ncbi:MAG: putative nucleotidyltransferase [Phenylobacterium sp.]
MGFDKVINIQHNCATFFQALAKTVVKISTNSLTNKVCSLVCQYLPQVQLIYLFGSMASNEQNADSDIDIAVMCDGQLDPIQRWDIAATLADKLGKGVDLVDLLSASTVMQHQITCKGICLYDPFNLSDSYAIRVLSMYHDLNIERADILNDFWGADNG